MRARSARRGRVANDTGDGVMATFDSAFDVLALAGVVQQSLNARDAWGRSRSRHRARVPRRCSAG